MEDHHWNRPFRGSHWNKGRNWVRGGRTWQRGNDQQDHQQQGPSTSGAGSQYQNTAERIKSLSKAMTFRHPGHLNGKDIGLYYRNRHRQLKQDIANSRPALQGPRIRKTVFMKSKTIPPIVLSQKRKTHIQNLLQAQLPETYNIFQDSTFKRDFLRIISESFDEKLATITTVSTAETSSEEQIVKHRELDEKYLQEYVRKKNDDAGYKRMELARKKLPAYAQKEEILEAIEKNQVVVISGETGCGKTTQVAQFILEDHLTKGNGSKCRIICTQPRRISAVSVAERVAQERNESLGNSVGYQIRLEKKLPRQQGSITFATTGVVLHQMVHDPILSTVSHLILDEIHERDVLSDFILTLSKIITEKRKDLKIILMSATLNAEKFSRYFRNCPHLNIPGFTFPVKQLFLEDALYETNYRFDPVPYQQKRRIRKQLNQHTKYLKFIEPHIANMRAAGRFNPQVYEQLRHPYAEKVNNNLILEVVRCICHKDRDYGAILIFLTGFVDISHMVALFSKQEFPESRYAIYALHSQMPTIQQKEIFSRPPPGIRKIIVATNIAETSITIDDVVFVIDCGKMKMKNFDSHVNIQTLLPQWVSAANANQRRGRAGRVQPGVCYHLYSHARALSLEDYQKPEIMRTRLEETILKIKILQLGAAQPFLTKFMDRPKAETVAVSIQFLQDINALDSDEKLTPLGCHLAKLPIHPQMGKMIILGALFGCLDPMLSIAAGLGFKDPFVRPLNMDQEANDAKMELSEGLQSDHMLLHQVIYRYQLLKMEDPAAATNFCWKYYLSKNIMDMLLKMKKDFAKYLFDMNFIPTDDHLAQGVNVNSRNISLVKAIICAGLYPNVGHLKVRNKQKNNPGQRFQNMKVKCLDNRHAKFHPSSINECARIPGNSMLVYFTKIKSLGMFIHDATFVQPLPVLFFAPNTVKSTVEGQHCILVDGKITIGCDPDTADLILQLKDRLNLMLEYKVSHPGTVDWSSDNMETATLKAIIELITSEDYGELSMGDYNDSDDDNDDNDNDTEDFGRDSECSDM